jgi:hypothetical protein
LDEINKDNQIGYLYTGEMVTNRKQNKIAVISDKFKQLEFYDYDLNLEKVTMLEKNYQVMGEFEQGDSFNTTDETKDYYNAIDFNNQHIFVLYDNRSKGDRREGICNDMASELHVFDWKGQPIDRYLLNGCPYSIAFDHINNRIIGTFPFARNGNTLIQYYQL